MKTIQIFLVVCLLAAAARGGVEEDYERLKRGKNVKVGHKLIKHMVNLACCSLDSLERLGAVEELHHHYSDDKLDKFDVDYAKTLVDNLESETEGVTSVKIIELVAGYIKDSKKIRRAVIRVFDAPTTVRFVHLAAGKALLNSFPKKFYELKVVEEKDEDIRLFQVILRDLVGGGTLSFRRNILTMLRTSKFDFEDLPDELRYELEKALLDVANESDLHVEVMELLRKKWQLRDVKSLETVLQDLATADYGYHSRFLLMLVQDFEYRFKEEVELLEHYVPRIQDDRLKQGILDTHLDYKDRCRKGRKKLSK